MVAYLSGALLWLNFSDGSHRLAAASKRGWVGSPPACLLSYPSTRTPLAERGCPWLRVASPVPPDDAWAREVLPSVSRRIRRAGAGRPRRPCPAQVGRDGQRDQVLDGLARVWLRGLPALRAARMAAWLVLPLLRCGEHCDPSNLFRREAAAGVRAPRGGRHPLTCVCPSVYAEEKRKKSYGDQP